MKMPADQEKDKIIQCGALKCIEGFAQKENLPIPVLRKVLHIFAKKYCARLKVCPVAAELGVLRLCIIQEATPLLRAFPAERAAAERVALCCDIHL